MLKAFTSPPTKSILLPEHEKPLTYINPDTDLHLQTSMVCYPEPFVGKHEWEWLDTANSTVIDGQAIRKSAKIVNFAKL